MDLTGVRGDWSDLLPASMVCGDERPRLLRRLDTALLHLHNILVVILPRRDCAPWQVTATVYMYVCTLLISFIK